MEPIPVYKISLPEYKVDTKPDFALLGRKIDSLLREHFLSQDIVVRVIGSQEHPGKTIDELTQTIQSVGTDRYDPGKKGDRYDNIEQKQINFFALDFSINESENYFEFLLEPFYTWPTKPIRVDIAIIYDPTQLEVIEHQYVGREGKIKKDGFVFKDQKNKQKAVKAILQIL